MPAATADSTVSSLIHEMTLDEKIRLVTGYMGLPSERSPELNADIEQYVVALPPSTARGTCGFVQGVDRLGIPDLHMEGAGAGLANIFERRDGAAVAFPAPLAQSATWNPSLKRLFGRRLAAEARDQGINVLLGGACNLVIEPRCGRAFEYHGEDPLLAGAMVAEEVIGVQEEGLLGSIKHFAANFQETGRFLVNSIVVAAWSRSVRRRGFEPRAGRHERAEGRLRARSPGRSRGRSSPDCRGVSGRESDRAPRQRARG